MTLTMAQDPWNLAHLVGIGMRLVIGQKLYQNFKKIIIAITTTISNVIFHFQDFTRFEIFQILYLISFNLNWK